MIAIVDTGGANLASVTYALSRLGVTFTLTQDIEVIKAAPRVLLPGVGAALDSMERLKKAELVHGIRALTQPVLGICLGMQLLFESSEEGNVECIGAIPGNVRSIPASKGITVPHMGWNRLTKTGESRLLNGIGEEAYVYFVHSFQAPSGPFVKAVSLHGNEIPAIIEQDNFFGCQFHPEKSGSTGAQILENFLS